MWNRGLPREPRVERSSPVQALGQALLLLLSPPPAAPMGAQELQLRVSAPGKITGSSRCHGANVRVQPCLLWGTPALPGGGSASLLPSQGVQGCLLHRLPERGSCAPGAASPQPPALSPHPCAWALGLRVCKETRPASLETWMWAGSPSWEPAATGRNLPGSPRPAWGQS